MTAGETDGYGGLLGAFPYALRRADSWLFRSYVLTASLVTGLLVVLFTLSVIRVLGTTAGFSVARAFFVLVGLCAVAPTVAPVLLVARTHRRGIDRRRGYELAVGLAGYLFVASLYGLAVAAIPETFVVDGEQVSRPPADAAGLFAPVVALLYAIPPAGSLAVPTAAAVLLGVVHFLRR